MVRKPAAEWIRVAGLRGEGGEEGNDEGLQFLSGFLPGYRP